MSDSERLHKFNLLQRNQGRTKKRGKTAARKSKSRQKQKAGGPGPEPSRRSCRRRRGMLGGTATRKRHRRVSYVLREEEGR